MRKITDLGAITNQILGKGPCCSKMERKEDEKEEKTRPINLQDMINEEDIKEQKRRDLFKLIKDAQPKYRERREIKNLQNNIREALNAYNNSQVQRDKESYRTRIKQFMNSEHHNVFKLYKKYEEEHGADSEISYVNGRLFRDMERALNDDPQFTLQNEDHLL